MKKNISRNPLWPDWYNGKKIDEVQFGRAFLEQWPLKCVNGTLYTLDGPVEDESAEILNLPTPPEKLAGRDGKGKTLIVMPGALISLCTST